jgi:hypothetical protein
MNIKAEGYKTKYQFKQKILKATESIINDYTTKHSKSMATRFDFHYPLDYQHDTSSNENISSCMAKIVKKYKRYGLDPSFIWAREQRYSEHPHYHCLIFLNGNKTNNPHHIFVNAEKIWSLTIGADASGLVHHCTHGRNGVRHDNGIMLDRTKQNYQNKLDDVFRQASYIAKDKFKGLPNDGIRDFGMTRINQSVKKGDNHVEP